jgi:hypothetical protein
MLLHELIAAELRKDAEKPGSRLSGVAAPIIDALVARTFTELEAQIPDHFQVEDILGDWVRCDSCEELLPAVGERPEDPGYVTDADGIAICSTCAAAFGMRANDPMIDHA